MPIREPKHVSEHCFQCTDFQRFWPIIFSSAFRDYKNKRHQVFPLREVFSCTIVSTHSLEVSSVEEVWGVLLANLSFKILKTNSTEDSKNFYLYNLNNVIAAACLCHDIGNPAFGHSGEDAIASFWKEWIRIKAKIHQKKNGQIW